MRVDAIPSATGGIARLVSTRLIEAGIDPAPLLARAGLTIEQIDNRDFRLNAQSQIRLLEFAADALQDDFIGFHLAQDYDLREIGLLYYVLASSENILADALHRAERYSGIANEGISLQVCSGKETAIALTYVGMDRRSDRHHMEFWLMSLVRLCRQLTNRRVVPNRIAVMHHRKKDARRVQVVSGLRDRIRLERRRGNVSGGRQTHTGRQRRSVSQPAAAEILRGGARASAGACDATLRSNVENAITPLLPHGKANAGEVARQLGMSRRTLARRLAAEQLTFSEIQTELKTDLAKRYLRDGDLPISQIAWLLGYREVSAFTHAFKRWTGTAPRQSRAQGRFVSSGKRIRTAARSRR